MVRFFGNLLLFFLENRVLNGVCRVDQLLQESRNSFWEFWGFFEAEKLGKSSAIVQFLEIFL